MDRGAWWAAVHGLQRIRHNLAIKYTYNFYFSRRGKCFGMASIYNIFSFIIMF